MSSAQASHGGALRHPSRLKHGLNFWATILGVGLVALVIPYLLFVEAPPPGKIRIASGGQQGAYNKYAQRYAAELKKQGLELIVVETSGSVENLQLLLAEHSDYDIAIVQGGVATEEQRQQAYSLGSIFREPLWVFYRGEKPIDRLSELAGKRIGIGKKGSGTQNIALQLLAANGMTSDGPQAAASAEFVPMSDADAADTLLSSKLDAAFFAGAFDVSYIKHLLQDENIRLLDFKQHEAYHRRFPFLSEVTVPAGLVNLGENLPPHDISLVAPTAMLVVRKNFHPALVPLFLTVATRIHGSGDELSNPGEFPSAQYTDFPLDEDAKIFYKFGPPVLQRLLPFWVAALVDRLKVMVIPLVVLLMPLIRTAPSLARWRTRRRIYRWYGALRDIDSKLHFGMASADIGPEIERLREIERKVTFVQVPLSYMDELYHLRLHISMVLGRLERLRTAEAESSEPARVEPIRPI